MGSYVDDCKMIISAGADGDPQKMLTLKKCWPPKNVDPPKMLTPNIFDPAKFLIPQKWCKISEPYDNFLN